MSHSIPLGRKIVVAFLLPIVALAAIAAVGVADATQDAELGESARTSFDRVARLQEAAVAVADERLATVLQEIDGQQGSDIDVEDAILTTDVAMDQLSVLGDELLNDRVWSALGTARTTPVGRSESYARATATLLDAAAQINVETVSSHAALLLDDLQRIHRLIEADDNAWLAFAARTSEDVRSTTEVAQFFAVAAAIRDDLDMRSQEDPATPIQQALELTRVMSDLQLTAMEDLLNSDQRLVLPRSALLSHDDARSRWLAARDQQAVEAASALDSISQAAENRRNSFGLYGLFGVLVIGAAAVALYQSVATPIASAASEAERLVTERLPEIEEALAGGQLSPSRPTHLSASTDDEIDQLVGAVNLLQDRFFDIAVRETATRQQISGRMVTIAHRNAVLLHELVRHVSSWRSADDSPEVRGRLFGIDHIATRLQRNIEAGLTLGGGRHDRRWTKPISAVNAARLALGEVTDFQLVDITPMAEVRLHGVAAPDVAHVLAEVIENGLAAGANNAEPNNRVKVGGEWVAAGWAFLVHDHGQGMEQAERDRINRALHTPGLVSDGSTTALGLALVSRIAVRFGLDVRLLERPTGGTTVRVILPVELIDPETVPPDRKRIDAGRGARPGEKTALCDGHQSAADAYFDGDSRSPLDEDHDLNGELRKLTEGIPSSQTPSDEQPLSTPRS